MYLYLKQSRKQANIRFPKTYQEDYFARRRFTFTNEGVRFECNTCTRNERLSLAMGSELDHFSDVFGIYEKPQRSTLRLVSHIENYTKRNLTYQSDALNALRAVFASILEGDHPVRQFWGIPVDAAGFTHSPETSEQENKNANHFEGFDCFFRIGEYNLFEDFEKLNNVDSEDLSSSRTNLYAILMSGLTWVQSYGAFGKRRNGFPSWSWAGWITPVYWSGSSHIHAESTARVDVIRRDGACVILTEDLIEKIFLDENNEASLYTYKLRLDIETIQVQVTDMGSEKSERYAVLKLESADVYWELYPTPSIENDPKLYETLCSESFDCILCTEECGIVVREKDGVAERIGLLNLWSGNHKYDSISDVVDILDEVNSDEDNWDEVNSNENDFNKEDSDEDSDEDSHGDDLWVDSDEGNSDHEDPLVSHQHIRNFFPVTRRIIILG
jgi:hypothetical protein